MPCKRVFPRLSDLAFLFPGPAETCPHPRLMLLSPAPVIFITGTPPRHVKTAVMGGAKSQSGLRRNQSPSPFEQTTRELEGSLKPGGSHESTVDIQPA